MNTRVLKQKGFVFLLVSILMVTFGIQSISYAQEANPTITASVQQPLTEAILHESVVTLTLSGGIYERSRFRIEDAITISGIEGVAIADSFGLDRISDTVVTIELQYAGNIDTDTTLTFTVGAGAIEEYNGNALIAKLPVTAVEESLEASTEVPLTEATLDGSLITLTLTGRRFTEDLEYAVSVSGIDSVTAETWNVTRTSYTEAIVGLIFSGNIDEDATLTLTVGADGMSYNKDFTFEFPVTAVEESLTASAAAPLTEANLDGSTVTLTLIGRQFADGFVDGWTREDAVSVSGIDGVTLAGGVWGPERVSDTEIAVELEFDGTDFDTDATLTFTVSALVSNHSSDLTAQIPVTAIQQSNATVSLSPTPVISPNIGEQLTFSINIEDGKDVAGYQATVLYDNSALRLMEATKGNYLPADAFFLPDWDHYRYAADETYGYTYVEARLTANTLAEAANGDGTLTTLTFEVLDFKPSTVPLSEIYLVDADGKRWEATTENGEVTIPPEPAEALFGDINRDGVVNIQDLVIVGTRLGQRGKNSADVNEDGLVNVVDIVLVASAFDAAAAAPALYPQALQLITAAEVKDWFSQAQQLTRTDPAYLRGMTVLEELLKALTPKKSALLPNYPNPFNPETWIPYHLSNSADVQVSIYDIKGMLVRRLDFGHQIAGYYTDRTKAAYWDGKNEFGESIASGLYFFTLTAGDFTATRKMLIRK